MMQWFKNKHKIFHCFLIFILCIGKASNAFSQSMQQQRLANVYATQAMLIVDNGKALQAIELYKKAIKLCPKNYDYVYELAYAYCINKTYDKAVPILKNLIDNLNATGKVYHLLGNCYAQLNKADEAIETYNTGIKLFPNTGELYFELGNNSLVNKAYSNALWYYENGIDADPSYASNYYRAAKILFSGTEKVWAMLYGEIFLGLEHNSNRSLEISKLIYNTYQSQLIKINDTSYAANFTADTFSSDSINNKKYFAIKLYQPMLQASMANEKNINLQTLYNARTKFVDLYIKNNIYLQYPNALMNYQYKVLKAGHFEAYNYWILQAGNQLEFENWKKTNSKKLIDFLNWFDKNSILLSKSEKLIREN